LFRRLTFLSRQARATRTDFAQQSSTLAGINLRMQSVISVFHSVVHVLLLIHLHILDTMPGINNLIGMIKSRRRRDAIIMGLVIGVCLILLLTYVF
jgi:Golgi SNAP receptor complex protein 1